MKDGAQRPPPPDAPPLGCSISELHQWFDALRAVDLDVTKFAAGIALEHFARAGVATHPDLPHPGDWKGFALYLHLSLSSTLSGNGDKEWVRSLLADLVEFSLLNPSGSPDARLAELLGQFIRWTTDYPRIEKFLALLPPQAVPALKLIEEWEAEEQRRKEEAYY